MLQKAFVNTLSIYQTNSHEKLPTIDVVFCITFATHAPQWNLSTYAVKMSGCLYVSLNRDVTMRSRPDKGNKSKYSSGTVNYSGGGRFLGRKKTMTMGTSPIMGRDFQ